MTESSVPRSHEGANSRDVSADITASAALELHSVAVQMAEVLHIPPFDMGSECESASRSGQENDADRESSSADSESAAWAGGLQALLLLGCFSLLLGSCAFGICGCLRRSGSPPDDATIIASGKPGSGCSSAESEQGGEDCERKAGTIQCGTQSVSGDVAAQWAAAAAVLVCCCCCAASKTADPGVQRPVVPSSVSTELVPFETPEGGSEGAFKATDSVNASDRFSVDPKIQARQRVMWANKQSELSGPSKWIVLRDCTVAQVIGFYGRKGISAAALNLTEGKPFGILEGKTGKGVASEAELCQMFPALRDSLEAFSGDFGPPAEAGKGDQPRGWPTEYHDVLLTPGLTSGSLSEGAGDAGWKVDIVTMKLVDGETIHGGGDSFVNAEKYNTNALLNAFSAPLRGAASEDSAPTVFIVDLGALRRLEDDPRAEKRYFRQKQLLRMFFNALTRTIKLHLVYSEIVFLLPVDIFNEASGIWVKAKEEAEKELKKLVGRFRVRTSLDEMDA